MGATLFDRSIITTENYRGVHHIDDETLEDTATYSVHRIVMQGDFDALKEIRDAHWCNEVIVGADTLWTDFGGCKADLVITSMQLAKRTGLRGTLTVTVKAFQRGYEGGIDFEIVAKDIHYWRQLCTSNVPKLDQIMLWEQMRNDAATTDLFYEYKYLDKDGTENEITDAATLALAEMIVRGVDSFNEYVPTLTISYTLAAHPTTLGVDNFEAGALLGKAVSASELTLNGQGFSNPIGCISASPSPVENFEGLYGGGGVIICTADQLRCNSDASYTLTRCFTKYRAVEKELYVGAGGEFGPYDSEGAGQ